MDFAKVIAAVVAELEAANIRYALIGGFAMALRGVQRATMDLDFILMLEDMDKADRILVQLGYQRRFRSDNVSHYISPDQAWGRIDILHAFRRPSVSMLARAEMIQIDAELRMPVAQFEDLIGLKIQAAINDPDRAPDDWHDIRLLLETAKRACRAIDWELVHDYLTIFHLEEKLGELKKIHGATDGS